MLILRVPIFSGLLTLVSFAVCSVTVGQAIRSSGIPVTGKLNITDVLFHHDPTEANIWENVANVLEHWKQAPSCGVDAASRLFAACSELKDDPSKIHIRDDAIKSLFAIRMAICETAEGGAKVPPACSQAMSVFNLDADRKTFVQNDIRIIESGSLPACIRSLQKEHFYWTSYSNHRQDAGKVCDAMHAGVEQQKIIMFYREVTDSLAGIVQVVDKHRAASDNWFQISELKVQGMIENYRGLTTTLVQQREEQASKTLKDFTDISFAVSEANQAIAEGKDGFASTFAHLQSSVLELGAFLPKLHTDLARLLTNASQDVIEIVNTQKNEIFAVTTAVLDLHDMIASGSFSQAIQVLVANVQDAQASTASMLETQKEQMALVEHTNAALMTQVSRQQQSRELTDDMFTKVQTISSGIDRIAGPMKIFTTLMNAYEESKWNIGILDIAVFGLFNTGSAILLLIAGLRLWGVCLYLSYWFIISLKACISHAQLRDGFTRFVRGFLDGFENYFDAIKLMAILLGLLTAAIIGLYFCINQDAKAVNRHELKEKPTVTSQQSPYRAGHCSSPCRAARAGTAPPML